MENVFLKGDTLRGSRPQTLLFIGKLDKTKIPDLPNAVPDSFLVVYGETEASQPLADSVIEDGFALETHNETAIEEHYLPDNETVNTDPTRAKPRAEFMQLERKIELSIYPNPNDDRFTLDVLSDAETEIDVLLMDMQGRILYQRKHAIIKGRNTVQFDISQEASAYYLLHVLEKGLPFTERINKG